MKATPAHSLGKLVLITSLLLVPATSQAAVLIGNLDAAPGNTSGTFLDQGTSKGMGFTVGNQDYWLDSVTLLLGLGFADDSQQDGNTLTFSTSGLQVQLFSTVFDLGTGLELPDSPLLTFVNPTFGGPGSFTEYSFTVPAGPAFTLAADQKYWIVARDNFLVDGQYSGNLWLGQFGAATPTGSGATHLGAAIGFGVIAPDEGSSFNNIYAVDVTAVPEPGAYALAAGLGLVAFIPYRLWRKRLESQ